MTVAPPGWYDSTEDPRFEHYWDGTRYTDTREKAAAGEPLPEPPEPTGQLHASDPPEPPGPPEPRQVSAPSLDAARLFKDLPPLPKPPRQWPKVAAAIAVVLLAIGGLVAVIVLALREGTYGDGREVVGIPSPEVMRECRREANGIRTAILAAQTANESYGAIVETPDSYLSKKRRYYTWSADDAGQWQVLPIGRPPC